MVKYGKCHPRDFRGMDTLFESSVLGIAGLGVYTMIKLRLKQKNQSSE